MATPRGVGDGILDEAYEEVVEFQCPICSTSVTDDDESCPSCGAIFVEPEDDTVDQGRISDELDEDGLLAEDYELAEDVEYGELDDDEIEAELAAMEADLESDDYDEPFSDAGYEDEPFDLDLAYEDDLELEEEVEQAFGTQVLVSADDHAALEVMSTPTLMERMFQRAGLGMFIAGGVASVLVILWDPIQGNPLSLGTMQLRFLVFSLAMFIVGFLVEMFQAYSLTSEDELLHTEG
jgi:hypothetical protein